MLGSSSFKSYSMDEAGVKNVLSIGRFELDFLNKLDSTFLVKSKLSVLL